MCQKILINILLVICLTACANTGDPRGDGFFGGIQGIYGGGYNNRIQEREAQLVKEQTINSDLQAKSEVLETEKKIQNNTLAIEGQRLAKIEEDFSLLESKVNRFNAKSNQQKKKLANLKLKIDDLRKRLNSQESIINNLDRQGGASSERFQILQQEHERLFKEYKKLLEYFQALSVANS